MMVDNWWWWWHRHTLWHYICWMFTELMFVTSWMDATLAPNVRDQSFETVNPHYNAPKCVIYDSVLHEYKICLIDVWTMQVFYKVLGLLLLTWLKFNKSDCQHLTAQVLIFSTSVAFSGSYHLTQHDPNQYPAHKYKSDMTFGREIINFILRLSNFQNVG